MLRDFSYLDEEIAAREYWRLRTVEYGKQCRLETPLPNFADLSAARQEQYRILREKMEAYRTKLRDREQNRQDTPLPDPPDWSDEAEEYYRTIREKLTRLYSSADLVWILHSTPVGLLAAQDVFQDFPCTVVPLLLKEREAWFHRVETESEQFSGIGWYGDAVLWWSFYEKQSPTFVERVSILFQIPPTESIWLLNTANGGRGSREIWAWNGTSARFVSEECCYCVEEGSTGDKDFL